MRKFLSTIVVATAILSVIANIPGAIFIGTMLFIVPGLILIAAPNVFLVSAAALIGSYVFERLGPRLAMVAGLAVLGVVAVALPTY